MGRIAWWRRSGPQPAAEPEPDFEAERKIIEAGREARRILQSGVLDDVRGSLMAEWANSNPRDFEHRDGLYAQAQAIERIRGMFQLRENELATRGIED